MAHYSNNFPEKEEAATGNVVSVVIEVKVGESGDDIIFAVVG